MRLKKANGQNYFIDFLKFIASLIIVLYHSWVFSPNNDSHFIFGYLVVDFYFIVCGYLMMKSLNKRNDETYVFMEKRIKRLLPAIIVCFIVSYIFTFGRNAFTLSAIFSNQVWGDLFLLKTYGYGGAISVAWWYLSAMLFTLALLYPLARKYKKTYTHYIAPLIIVVTLALVSSFNISFEFHPAVTLVFCNGFFKAVIYMALGSMAYDVSGYISKKKIKNKTKLLLTIYEFLIYILLFTNTYTSFMGLIPFAILFTLNVCITFSNITYSKNIFKHKIWNKLATYGFYLYLVHGAVRTYFMRHNTYKYNSMLLKYFVVSLIVTAFVYFILEYIYPKIKNKKKKRK